MVDVVTKRELIKPRKVDSVIAIAIGDVVTGNPLARLRRQFFDLACAGSVIKCWSGLGTATARRTGRRREPVIGPMPKRGMRELERSPRGLHRGHLHEGCPWWRSDHYMYALVHDSRATAPLAVWPGATKEGGHRATGKKWRLLWRTGLSGSLSGPMSQSLERHPENLAGLRPSSALRHRASRSRAHRLFLRRPLDRRHPLEWLRLAVGLRRLGCAEHEDELVVAGVGARHVAAEAQRVAVRQLDRPGEVCTCASATTWRGIA